MYEFIFNYLCEYISKNDFSVETLKEAIFSLFYSIASDIGLGKLDIELNIKEKLYSDESRLYSATYTYNKYASGLQKTYDISTASGNAEFRYYPIDKFCPEQTELIDNILQVFFKSYDYILLNHELEEYKYRESLTGALNTAGFHRQLHILKAMNKVDEYVVVFFNIKGFKNINKKFGSFHNGNMIIKEYVNYIQQFLNPEESIVRHGGDNFSLLVKKENINEILSRLETVTIGFNFNNKVETVVLNSNAGYYPILKDDNIESVLQCANIAMTLAKANGVSSLEFTDDIRYKMRRKIEIINEFDPAMRDGKIIPFYQPKVDIRDNSLCGSEALIRWNYKGGKMLSPGEFIPILEEEKRLVDADFYVLDAVCKSIKKQLNNGIEPVKVSVNFGREHFNSSYAFEDRIIEVLRRNGVDPKYIEVEMTESGLFNNLSRIKTCIEKLHKANISVSIDDYGTGYSSLKLLSKVDFDVVKMDKSFADDIGTKTGDIVFHSTRQLLSRLNKKIICEGIETEQQIEFLRNIGCNYVQGYYYDRPLPEEEYVQRLVQRKYK